MPYKIPERRRAQHRAYMRRYLSDPVNKQKHLEYVRKQKQTYKARWGEMLAAFRASGCSRCPESDPACLDAHHVEGKDFSFAEGTVRGIALRRLQEELRKCICLCANCHRKLHAEERKAKRTPGPATKGT